MCIPCTMYIVHSIHTECDDLRPSAVEDCHDRSSKSNAAGQSTTGACVTLEGAARPDLGCSCCCKRERETAFKPSHLPSQSHNTHNTQREYSQYSHAQSLKSWFSHPPPPTILSEGLWVQFDPRGARGAPRPIGATLLSVSPAPPRIRNSTIHPLPRCRGARVPFCLSWPRHCRRSWWLVSNGSHFPPPSHLSRPGTDLTKWPSEINLFSRKFVKRQSNHFPPVLCRFPFPPLCRKPTYITNILKSHNYGWNIAPSQSQFCLHIALRSSMMLSPPIFAAAEDISSSSI